MSFGVDVLLVTLEDELRFIDHLKSSTDNEVLDARMIVEVVELLWGDQ
jgi:hypothetical protein